MKKALLASSIFLIIIPIGIAVITKEFKFETNLGLRDIISFGSAIFIAYVIAWNVEKSVSDFRREKDMYIDRVVGICTDLNGIRLLVSADSGYSYSKAVSSVSLIRKSLLGLSSSLTENRYKKAKEICFNIQRQVKYVQDSITGDGLSVNESLVVLNESQIANFLFHAKGVETSLDDLRIQLNKS